MMGHKIEWLNPPGYIGTTWNPVTGCSKISRGCEHCYAARMAKRLAGRCGYPANDPFRVTMHDDRLSEPQKWPKNGRPRFCFVCSMGDLFHSEVWLNFVDAMFAVMALRPRDVFLILTKRAGNMRNYIISSDRTYGLQWQADEMGYDDAALDLIDSRGWPLSNVWLGVTAEDQAAADERIPRLLETPAAVRFVSVEPMLGAVDLSEHIPCRSEYYQDQCHRCGEQWLDEADVDAGKKHVCPEGFGPTLDWVICGGENGPGARPMHADWARGLRDQCVEASAPFFFKSWGAGRHNRMIDGRTWDQWPEEKKRGCDG